MRIRKSEDKEKRSVVRTVAELVCYALGITCGWYSVVIYRVHSGSVFFLVWDAIGLLLAVLGIFIRCKTLKRLPKVLKIVLGSIAGVVLLFMLIILCFIRTGYRAEKTEETADLDYIIVLGAQVRNDGPSIVLRFRLDRAVEYLNGNPRTKCVVSGGKGSNEICSEAEAMKAYLVQHGIAEDRIIMEDRSTTTKENMKFSRRLIPDGSTVGIITNNFHIYRSLLIAEKNGFSDTKGVPAGSIKKYEANNILREIMAVAREWVTK